MPANQSNATFHSITLNAIDFLERSIKELEKSPKYSVINFYNSIELFLKARLLKEHWSLIVYNPANANHTKFIQGDFRSTGLEDTIARLRDISKENVEQKVENLFKRIRNHRNKLIHFYHDQYMKGREISISDVIPEQYSAWHYMYILLTEQWGEIFKDYKKDFDRINNSMQKHRDYLDAKYQELKVKIDEDMAKGIKYTECFFCKHKSGKINEIDDPLYSYECCVCGIGNHILIEKCPECDIDIEIKDLCEGVCSKCGKKIDLSYLIEKYGPDENPKEDTKIAYCGMCEYPTPSAIPFNDEYLCLNCLDLFPFKPEKCKYCGELNIATNSDTCVFGCTRCDGELGNGSNFEYNFDIHTPKP